QCGYCHIYRLAFMDVFTIVKQFSHTKDKGGLSFVDAPRQLIFVHLKDRGFIELSPLLVLRLVTSSLHSALLFWRPIPMAMNPYTGKRAGANSTRNRFHRVRVSYQRSAWPPRTEGRFVVVEFSRIAR